MEPRPRAHPVALGRAHRHVQRLGGLLFAQSGDEPALDDLGQPRRLRLEDGERLWINGAVGEELLLTRPAVLQLEVDGEIVDGAYWLTDVPVPPWVSLRREQLPREVRRRLILGSSATTATLMTGTFFAISAINYYRFTDDGTANDQLLALRRRTNLTSGLGIGTAVLSAGLTTALVITCSSSA